METVKQDWRRIGLFLMAASLFWAIWGYLLSQFGYVGAFRVLNPFHHPITDNLSLYFLTHLGDGLILPGILILWVGRKDPSLALAGFATILLTGVLVQIGKNWIFEDMARPPVVFADDPMIRIFHPHPPRNHSFPSGHSASMMSGGLAFAIYLGRKKAWLAFAVGLFSAMLCYTRVVLGVHFPGDILVGGMIGGILGAPILMFLYPRIKGVILKIPSGVSTKLGIIGLVLAGLAIVGQFINQIFIKL